LHETTGDCGASPETKERSVQLNFAGKNNSLAHSIVANLAGEHLALSTKYDTKDAPKLDLGDKITRCPLREVLGVLCLDLEISVLAVIRP
jgi:hypothetical protein